MGIKIKKNFYFQDTPHLAKSLLKQSYQVVGIDNLKDYYDSSLKQSRLEILEKYEDFNFHKVDLKDKEAEKNYMEMQPGDVLRTYADVSDLERGIAFRTSTTIEKGFRNS